MERKNSSVQFNIDYSRDDDAIDDTSELRRRVVPATGVFDGHCLSTQPLYFRAHRVSGKTIPHLRANCPGCASGNKGEPRCYIWFRDLVTARLCPLDLPLGCYHPLKVATERFGSLKGLRMKFSRRPATQQGRVEMAIATIIDPEWSMVHTPSLQAWCERQWRKHLAICMFSEHGTAGITTDAEEERSAAPAATGRPTRKRKDGTAAGDMSRMRTTDGQPLDIAQVLASAAAAAGVSKVNGHPSDAS